MRSRKSHPFAISLERENRVLAIDKIHADEDDGRVEGVDLADHLWILADVVLPEMGIGNEDDPPGCTFHEEMRDRWVLPFPCHVAESRGRGEDEHDRKEIKWRIFQPRQFLTHGYPG